MVRLADLMHAGEGETPPPRPLPKAAPAAAVSPPVAGLGRGPTGAPPAAAAPAPAGVQAERGVARPPPTLAIPDEVLTLYAEAHDVVQEALARARAGQPPDAERLLSVARTLAGRMDEQGEDLVACVTGVRARTGLTGHHVNSAIVALAVAAGLGWPPSARWELAVAALVFDLGLATVDPATATPADLQAHTTRGADLLGPQTGIGELPGIVALQHHERVRGQGYPRGLKIGEIHECAQVVGLAELFDTIVRGDGGAAGKPPHEAIKQLITTDSDLFEIRMIKALVNQIGIYPIGSWVKLSTNQIGRVARLSREYPLRPTVQVVVGSGGRQVEDVRAVDLAREESVYIKGPVAEVELAAKLSSGWWNGLTARAADGEGDEGHDDSAMEETR